MHYDSFFSVVLIPKQIYYWNVTINEWEIVINSGYNIINNYLWINTTYFGIFGIFVYTVDVYCQENIVYTRPNQIVNNTIIVNSKTKLIALLNTLASRNHYDFFAAGQYGT